MFTKFAVLRTGNNDRGLAESTLGDRLFKSYEDAAAHIKRVQQKHPNSKKIRRVVEVVAIMEEESAHPILF